MDFFAAQPSLRSWLPPCSYCTRKPISYPHLPLVSILSSSFSLSTLKSWGFQTHCCHWRTFSRRFSLVESSILYKKLSMENPKKAKKLPNRVIFKTNFHKIENQNSKITVLPVLRFNEKPIHPKLIYKTVNTR